MKSITLVGLLTLTCVACQPTNPPSAEAKLSKNSLPSENFDLRDWKLTIPSDSDKDGRADQIKELELSSGYSDPRFFYSSDEGAMVFRCPIKGAKTSKNTTFARTELREMLRRGNDAIATKGVDKNNWVFSSTPSASHQLAGGINGVLEATLAVNHVTISGSRSQVGRVIVGQIHANDDEPLRLYYRKLPENERGSIYFAHEPRGKDDIFYELIGSLSDDAEDPEDGIALDEKFSYKIEVKGNSLEVTIIRPNQTDIAHVVDMSNSGYDHGSQYQYFKAGVYNQNNTGKDDDYVQASFYALSNRHEGYSF